MRLPIATYGRRECFAIVSLFLLASGAIAYGTYAFGVPGLAPLAALPAALGAFWASFYRDFEREITGGDGVVVSPADGRVTDVVEVDEKDYLGCRALRVGIFLSPLNVHVNRAPVDGRVVSVTHVAGGFVPAFRKESERNERVVIEYDTPLGPVTTVQIAGTVARRIVPYVKAGDLLRKGDRIGIIRLGSRVDVYLPADVQPSVAVGDKVHAGSTRLGLPRGKA